MFRLIVSAVTLWIIGLSQPFIALGQERARVGWAAMTASHTPLWVAQEKGVFGETRFVGGIDLFWCRSTGNAGSRGRRSGYRCHLGA